MRLPFVAAALCLAVAAPALAAPPRERPLRVPSDPDAREEVLRDAHTTFVIELGELLSLDAAGTIRLRERLQKFEAQRAPLRREMIESMQTLEKVAAGKVAGDGAALARKGAQYRLQMAEIARQELEEILVGLSSEQAAKVALFLARLPKRMELPPADAAGARPAKAP